ncbi:unnamed protein product, partial [Mesorhabditis belari]|uniref:Dynamin GTPase n=1 Tax=Mesorhabditis belari TaxID=2138241 RepID=A0AAF3J2W1_9BILA
MPNRRRREPDRAAAQTQRASLGNAQAAGIRRQNAQQHQRQRANLNSDQAADIRRQDAQQHRLQRASLDGGQMESLISKINKLQDVFAVVGSREAEIQLPQIVVVGAQSAGKSSVIEAIVGRDFLPRGTGIVTRRPLILQLCHTAAEDEEKRKGREGDWAQFEHTNAKIFEDFELVRKEIADETDRSTGTNKGIDDMPISLKIFSDRFPNLTLVDLPGMTKIPVGDQPLDIEQQILKMIMHYINNPNSIILAVTPANQDFATSEPMKMAKDVDPEGERTLAVLTKLDLMDRGTNALDILSGQLVDVKLGIVGVVNRSQADIMAEKPMDEALQAEEAFFQKEYPNFAKTQGTRYLSVRLNVLLMNHIHECLPSLKDRVASLISQYGVKLNVYGRPIEDKNQALLKILTRFSAAYRATIEGTTRYVEAEELCGGARICYIFHEIYSKLMNSIDPLKNLLPSAILAALRNATGARPALFVPEVAFALLVKKQIQRLEEPSLKCVDLVHQELQRLVSHCGKDVQQEMTRFPRLFEAIKRVLGNILKDRLNETKSLVGNFLAVEGAYINTRHPEFADAKLIDLFKNSFVENLDERNEQKELVARNEARNAAMRKELRDQQRQPQRAHLQQGNLNENTLTKVPEKLVKEELTPNEQRDCEIMERLIASYFSIVCKNVQDLVPKTIMHNMVDYVTENLHAELVGALYNSSKLNELLGENERMAQQRKEAMAMLEALNQANDIIGEVSESDLVDYEVL